MLSNIHPSRLALVLYSVSRSNIASHTVVPSYLGGESYTPTLPYIGIGMGGTTFTLDAIHDP